MKKCSLSEMHNFTNIVTISANGYPIVNKIIKHIGYIGEVRARSNTISNMLHQKCFGDRGRMKTPFCMIYHELICPFSYAYHNSGKKIR